MLPNPHLPLMLGFFLVEKYYVFQDKGRKANISSSQAAPSDGARTGISGILLESSEFT